MRLVTLIGLCGPLAWPSRPPAFRAHRAWELLTAAPFVKGRWGAGTGRFSQPSAGMVAGAPGQPGGVQVVSLGHGAVQVSFTAPMNNGAPVTSYHARCTSKDGGQLGHASGPHSPIKVTSLTVGKTYTCTVSATNSRGRGPASRPSAPVTA